MLNSLSAARDLLDKRSANFSGRPRQVVAGEMYISEGFFVSGATIDNLDLGWAGTLAFHSLIMATASKGNVD